MRRLCFAALLALTPAGCAETGDFGRPKTSLWNDLTLSTTASLVADAPWQPVSRYMFTDDEDELRDRAWRFLMPAHERPKIEAVIANLMRAGGLPVDVHLPDRIAYHQSLMSGSFRSPASRYRRLSEDALADLKLIGPFAFRASRVMAADRVRLRSLAHIRDLAEWQVRDAVARVAENRCLIVWIRYETYKRLISYRYALEHLVIEAPQSEAIATERTLAGLETHRRTLDTLVGHSGPGTSCGDMPEAPVLPPAPFLADLPPEREAAVFKD